MELIIDFSGESKIFLFISFIYPLKYTATHSNIPFLQGLPTPSGSFDSASNYTTLSSAAGSKIVEEAGSSAALDTHLPAFGTYGRNPIGHHYLDVDVKGKTINRNTKECKI